MWWILSVSCLWLEGVIYLCLKSHFDAVHTNHTYCKILIVMLRFSIGIPKLFQWVDLLILFFIYVQQVVDLGQIFCYHPVFRMAYQAPIRRWHVALVDINDWGFLVWCHLVAKPSCKAQPYQACPQPCPLETTVRSPWWQLQPPLPWCVHQHRWSHKRAYDIHYELHLIHPCCRLSSWQACVLPLRWRWITNPLWGVAWDCEICCIVGSLLPKTFHWAKSPWELFCSEDTPIHRKYTRGFCQWSQTHV